MTLKVAVIGNEDYYETLSKAPLRGGATWDWQVPCKTIDDFYDAINDGRISKSTPMLIVDPELYYIEHKAGRDGFEELVATMAPYCLVAVIAFNEHYDSTPKDEIQASVSKYAGSDESLSSHFYWLDSDDIIQSIYDAAGQYVTSPDSAKDAADILAEELRILQPETEDDEAEDDDGRTGDDGTVFNDPDQPEFINSLGRKGTVIAVTSAKGGSGKSTVAYSLAQEIGLSSAIAAERGNLDAPLDVCLVDMDVYDGQLGFVIGASQPTILNISKEPTIDQKSVGRNLITNKLVEKAKKQKGEFISFSALLAPKSPRYVEHTPPNLWRDVINVLTTMFDIIILDTSVMYFLDPIIYEVAYPEADKILYITDLDIKSILDTTKWMQNVCTPKDEEGYGGFGIGLEKVGIVINKGMTKVGMGPNKIKQILAVATRSIYRNIDDTIPVDKLPTPHVLTMIPSYPKLITEASNNQNLGAIIKVPQIEGMFRRLARAVVPASVAPKLEDAADPDMREEYESKRAASERRD